MTDQVEKLIDKMRNGHLPAKLGWIAYCFKLWAGVRYGLASLATSFLVAKGVLKQQNFKLLAFLGVNCNVKREWRTLHQAFGRNGLFSFAVEQMIGMINIFTRHYEGGTTLAKKFTASLEALQLEIGCIRNPLLENYDELRLLGTACWTKSFWEQLHFYRFAIHMEYAPLQLLQQNDALIVTILQCTSYTGNKLATLNRCRIANKMFFLSDIATACTRYIDCTLLGPLVPWLHPQSTYTFPQEVPSSKGWLLWRTFWTLYSGPGGLLHIPLGEWLHPSNRICEWFYVPTQDQLQHVKNNGRTV